jgi:hypothetical protein
MLRPERKTERTFAWPVPVRIERSANLSHQHLVSILVRACEGCCIDDQAAAERIHPGSIIQLPNLSSFYLYRLAAR